MKEIGYRSTDSISQFLKKCRKYVPTKTKASQELLVLSEMSTRTHKTRSFSSLRTWNLRSFHSTLWTFYLRDRVC
jgi:hypothetical protein